VLKLQFNIVDTASSTPLKAQQVHLQFKDVETGDTVVLPVIVKSKGNARFDLVGGSQTRRLSTMAKPHPNDVVSPLLSPTKQKAASLPPSLTHSTGTFTLTLNIGHPSTIHPFQYLLGTLTLPTSLLHAPSPYSIDRHALPPPHGFPAFKPQPEIAHTFRPDEKTVGKVQSSVGTWGVVVVPWIVLAGLVSSFFPRHPPDLGNHRVSVAD
jgi:oligosaccharyltransferase complex subunit delta (ribophorin II)